jgi:pyruvate kinase
LTCGPASNEEAILRKFADQADAIRLNIAHISSDQLNVWLSRLNDIRQQSGRNFSVLLDLQGAKVRIGKVPAVENLPEKVTLFYGDSSDDCERIPVANENVFLQTQLSEQLFLNDRKVILEVKRKGADFLETQVIQNGPLSSAKGINSPDRVFEMARVTQADARAIAIAREFERIEFAVSFVADGHEAALFKPLTGNCRLIAKIEQRAAFSHLARVASGFDEIWLCRGDLGAEAGLANLGMLQQEFSRQIPSLSRPCLIAGEVLGSMVLAPQPSRAEIVQLYDSLQAGFCGFVLSDETAGGSQVEAVLEFLENFFEPVRIAESWQKH